MWLVQANTRDITDLFERKRTAPAHRNILRTPTHAPPTTPLSTHPCPPPRPQLVADEKLMAKISRAPDALKEAAELQRRWETEKAQAIRVVHMRRRVCLRGSAYWRGYGETIRMCLPCNQRDHWLVGPAARGRWGGGSWWAALSVSAPVRRS